MTQSGDQADAGGRDGLGFVAVTLGDRWRKAPALYIVSDGAIRGLLTPGAMGEVVLSLACDQRLMSPGDLVTFDDLEQARRWLRERLPPVPRPKRRDERTERTDASARSLARGKAELAARDQATAALLEAAIAYCQSLWGPEPRIPPTDPIRILQDAWISYQALLEPGGAP